MILFDAIRYPVPDDYYASWRHVPDEIWQEWKIQRSKTDEKDKFDNDLQVALMRKVILEWEDPL